MERICHELQQGSDQWLAFRKQHFGGSEAAAMLGLSSKVTRNELLHMKKTGTAQEFSDWVQKNILDYGHEVEALARPIVERMIADELYPATYSFGSLSASADGLTMDGSIAFEHKQYNAALFASVSDGVVPDEYMPQCQQVLLVTGADFLFFACSDGTEERFAAVRVYPDAQWQDRIVKGWEQFAKDLDAYVPQDVKPELVAAPVPTLPAVVYTIDRSSLAVKSNIEAYREVALALVERSKAPMVTDQDFVDRKELCTKFRDAQKMLEAKADEVVGQIENVAKLSNDLRDIAAIFQAAAIAGEKLYDAEQKNRKTAIVAAGQEALRAHHAALTAQIGKPYLPAINADFAAATKNLRSLTSYQNAVDTAVANAKIAADQLAALIVRNVKAMAEAGEAYYPAQFRDEAQLALKDAEFVDMTITTRIAAEQQRLEAERERIRAEEQAKAEAAARKATEEAAEKARAEERQRAQAEINAAAQSAFNSINEAQRAEVVEPQLANDLRETVAFMTTAAIIENVAPKAPAAVVSTAPAVSGPPTLKLGVLCARLGVTVTADFLESIGFVATVERGAKLYHEHQFPAICNALIARIAAARDGVQQAKAA